MRELRTLGSVRGASSNGRPYRERDGWWVHETDPGVRGIDQSLANPSQLGKRLGTKLVRALVEMLFEDPEVTKIQTDPSPKNPRAIRCYEKEAL